MDVRRGAVVPDYAGQRWSTVSPFGPLSPARLGTEEGLASGAKKPPTPLYLQPRCGRKEVCDLGGAEVLVGEKLPNPTGHRLSRSQTLAKYNQPSSVWM